jgi:galactose mutarotase-like enzyme
MILLKKWQGRQAVILQNSSLSTVILPEHGGKVASLFHRGKEFELLFQNPHRTYRKAKCGSDFSEFEACGFDDAFPTIDPCEVLVNSSVVRYPDHGEIWSAAFEYAVEDSSVILTYVSKLLPYRYKKTFCLNGASLVCKYRIQNTGEAEFPYLWAFHCLVNCEKGMRLIYPDGVTAITNVLDCNSFGKAGSQYPLAKSVDRLPEDPMIKYYITGKVKEGKCGYYYPKKNITVLIEFDPDSLPYLGFWCTDGGYRGDVNCAFEPASGFYDSALGSYRHGTGSVLHPNETFSFQIIVTLK